MPAWNARHWSADQDAAVVAAYTKPKRGLLKRLSIDWDIPVSAINYHAIRHLDLSPTRRIRRKDTWIAAEDQLLRNTVIVQFVSSETNWRKPAINGQWSPSPRAVLYCVGANLSIGPLLGIP